MTQRISAGPRLHARSELANRPDARRSAGPSRRHPPARARRRPLAHTPAPCPPPRLECPPSMPAAPAARPPDPRLVRVRAPRAHARALASGSRLRHRLRFPTRRRRPQRAASDSERPPCTAKPKPARACEDGRPPAGQVGRRPCRPAGRPTEISLADPGGLGKPAALSMGLGAAGRLVAQRTLRHAKTAVAATDPTAHLDSRRRNGPYGTPRQPSPQRTLRHT